MMDESRRPMSETDCADGTELSTVGEDTHQMAARIAQKFRDAGLGCEIFNFMPADAAVLRRDHVAVVLALALLTALAWSYLLWLSADMSVGGMDMGDFRMIPSGMGLMVPAQVPWQAIEFAFVFVMWTVMMVGMMTPSAAPGRPLAATVWFTAGYFLVWIGFALLATVLQWAFERAALLDSWMGSRSNVLGGFLFVMAGTYQWTRLKEVCLIQCQRPFAFLMRQGGFRHGANGSLMLGLRYGAYCFGCCWALTALLFAGGVMNMLWIAVLALIILLKKIIPVGSLLARLVGIGLVAEGVWLLSM